MAGTQFDIKMKRNSNKSHKVASHSGRERNSNAKYCKDIIGKLVVKRAKTRDRGHLGGARE